MTYRMRWLAAAAALAVLAAACAWPAAAAPSAVPATQPQGVNALCPVTPDERTSAAHETVYQGVPVRFCCRQCKERFLKNPEPYLGKLPHVPATAPSAAAPAPASSAGAGGRAMPWNRWLVAVEKFLDTYRVVMVATTAALLVHALAAQRRRRDRREGRRGRGAAALLGHPAVPLLVALASAGGFVARRAATARASEALEREASARAQVADQQVERRFLDEMARQARLQGPEFLSRLQKTYYRGNDDRGPTLYNGGIYQTCRIHVSLRTDGGRPVAPGDRVDGRRLVVRVEIERSPNTMSSHFQDAEMTKAALLSRELTPSVPRAGDEPPHPFTVEVPGQRWAAACPVGDATSAAAQSIDGMVLLVPGSTPEETSPWARANYGLQYDLRLERGTLAASSKLWLGAVFFTEELPDARLYEWISRDPLPTIPDEFHRPANEVDPSVSQHEETSAVLHAAVSRAAPPRLFPLPLLMLAGADTAGAPTSPRMVNDRCPVMEEEPASPQHEVQFRGYAVRFCCEKCQDKFAADPLPYLSHLPQLPVATIQAAVAESQQKARTRHDAGMPDHWARPVFLILATLLTAWLVLRVARRFRSARPTPVDTEALDAGDDDLRAAHGRGGGGAGD